MRLPRYCSASDGLNNDARSARITSLCKRALGLPRKVTFASDEASNLSVIGAVNSHPVPVAESCGWASAAAERKRRIVTGWICVLIVVPPCAAWTGPPKIGYAQWRRWIKRERQNSAGGATAACRRHAGLDHASGRAVPARVSRGAREGFVFATLQDAGSGRGSDHSAGQKARSGRGDHLFGHPDPAGSHGF